MIGQPVFTGGVNFTTVTADRTFLFGNQDFDNFRLTPLIGFGYNIRINDKWSYNPLVAGGDIGGITMPREPKDSNVVIYIYTISLHQFADYKLSKRLSVGFSPSLSYNAYSAITGRTYRNVNGKVTYNPRGKISWKRVGEINRFIISVTPRISCIIAERWSIDLFYRKDLSTVDYPGKYPTGDKKSEFVSSGVGLTINYNLK